MVTIETQAPLTLAQADFRPRGRVYPSPIDWRDQNLYFLLPDRFSDGQESTRPRFDPTQPDRFRTTDIAAWMESGKRFQGGTLNGIRSKLDYLKELGITALWIGPIWKQRADLETYHGYGVQNFLEVDPRFGTRQDLRDLVDAAHDRGIYVLLDIILNHTGNNWYYDNSGQAWNSMPYRYHPPYPVHGWRSGAGEPIRAIQSIEDGVYPREFQNLEWYTRAGSIGRWDAEGWEDPLHPEVEFRRGDFFDLKDLDLERDEVCTAITQVYQYWIALSDCDGFRIDTVKHIPKEASRKFCSGIREYAESIGKDNFWLLGEVTGGPYMAKSYLDVLGRNLDAILDIGGPRLNIANVVKGFADPEVFFEQYHGDDVLGSHREMGNYHVSILDDHDMVGSPKRRFAAGPEFPAKSAQVAHAVGFMLTTLGIPCVYYGTEQALDGSEERHDYRVEGSLSFEDRYVRESMFGGTFGAFQTEGCHFFNPDHPTYLRISAINRLRNQPDLLGLTLRRGRQYLREIAYDHAPFHFPRAGEVMAWSRIMFDREVVIAYNTNGVADQTVNITVDGGLHPAGSSLAVCYRSDWHASQLRTPPTSLDTLQVANGIDGRAMITVTLPPAGMIILG
ncbi:MAG: alpha-amylase family glycosyl hydrolase [Anaerolineae bacterium]|nr:alpha-amylase family glycosyl hydrolase [Anaerolineae bacterium]